MSGNIDITYRTLRVDSIDYILLKKRDEYRNYLQVLHDMRHDTQDINQCDLAYLDPFFFLEIFEIGKCFFTWISIILGTITCFPKI